MNLFFMTSYIFFGYDDDASIYFTLIDFLFMVLILNNLYFARKALIGKSQSGFKSFIIIRTIIELVKLSQTILIMMGFNSAFEISGTMKSVHGNIRFSMLLQEILSIQIYIPIMSLGKYIFTGFSFKKFDVIYAACLFFYKHGDFKYI